MQNYAKKFYLCFMLRKQTLIIGLLLFVFGSIKAQDTLGTRIIISPDNTPQKEYFSIILGYKVDTVINPKLYENTINWLGTRYRYSGDDYGGIDCSGFVSSVYENAYNKTLANSSGAIFNQNVTPLDKSELKEGDLVFFKIKKGRISHIGIYLGNNKFAHASRKIGVTVSDLNEPYYVKRFYKGGRVM